MKNKIIIVPDVHCRDFYKPVLNIKDKPVIFLGDYMDPYWDEGTTDEQGIENLKEIFEFARNNKNVTLLCGNHDCSWIWSHLGWERTHFEFYNELHKLYRDNIDLLKPCLKVNNVLFTHAGVNKGWLDAVQYFLEENGSSLKLTQNNIDIYIGNEFQKELVNDHAFGSLWSPYLSSNIFWIGRCRGGDSSYGGPFWSDFDYDYSDPIDWNIKQIFSHTQRWKTGSIGQKENGYCIDSRAIFEYDFDKEELSLWEGENSEEKK